MEKLANKKCVPCESGTEPLKLPEIAEYIDKLDNEWEVLGGKKIICSFEFKDFKEAMNFVNKVADVAEEEGHHPDILISWNKVTISLWTHSINGLSENDFIIAAKAEELE